MLPCIKFATEGITKKVKGRDDGGVGELKSQDVK